MYDPSTKDLIRTVEFGDVLARSFVIVVREITGTIVNELNKKLFCPVESPDNDRRPRILAQNDTNFATKKGKDFIEREQAYNELAKMTVGKGYGVDFGNFGLKEIESFLDINFAGEESIPVEKWDRILVDFMEKRNPKGESLGDLNKIGDLGKGDLVVGKIGMGYGNRFAMIG